MAKTKIDILLVSVPGTNNNGAIWKQIERRFPSIGILSLASYIREHGFTPYIIDGTLEALSNSEIIIRIKELFKHHQIPNIGFSITTLTYYDTKEIIENLIHELSETRIIVGGAHPSALPEESLNDINASIVVRGEGETQLLAILQNKPLEEIKGISYTRNKEIIHNQNAPRIKKLDDLPIPAYDLVPMGLSKPFIGQFVGLKKVVPSSLILASRGCIGNCTFCSKCFAPGVSFKTPEYLLNEILYLKNNFNIQHFLFYDDTFTSNKKLINEFCHKIITQNINITWTCSSRADCVTPDLLSKMKQAGCIQVLYGIESFNDEVLTSINKRTNTKNNIDAIIWTKKSNIVVRVAIMIGNPSDTKSTINHNIKMLQKLQPDLLQVTITTPLPGSQLFRDNLKENLILTKDWSKYDGNYMVSKHETLTEKELKKYYYKTYYCFYFNYRFLLRKLFSLSTYKGFKIYILGLFSFVPVFWSWKKKQ
ncbi:MAG TPA: radical SAM protein [Bacteroidales bacterium]|nr:radical SAM protein [Bacteroidales bacterium]